MHLRLDASACVSYMSMHNTEPLMLATLFALLENLATAHILACLLGAIVVTR